MKQTLTHDSDTPLEKLREEFLSMVAMQARGCWIFLGPKNSCGYGCFHFHRQKWFAHRLSYAIHYGNGEIDKSGLICHKCDNPSCVNPKHLFYGTQKDNMQDCAAKNRIHRSGSIYMQLHKKQ